MTVYLAYNEVLISSNEEMQSTNEELQSVNEELQTVNNEYQLKIKELDESNDDLNNYFNSTINAQIYVDNDLILRKFTSSAIKQINLKASVGRLLTDISTNIRFSTIIDDINAVFSSSDTVEKEVQTLDGRWYQMIAMPYIKQIDNENNGVIVTFNDITELKRVQEKISRINADHDTFIYSVSYDLKGPLSNLNGLVSYLKESVTPLSDETKGIMDIIHKSTINFTDIINELSDIAKIETDIETYENIDIKNILNEVELSIKDKMVKSGAKINLELNVLEIPISKKIYEVFY